MSFMYPRTISVKRPATNSGTGAIGYGGELPSTETSILSGMAASIQHRSGQGRTVTGLPADAPKGADWYIFVPKAAEGSITENDIITDDLFKRYQVIAAYWNSLGYRVAAQLLRM
jgi:hypothetical protein